MDTWDNSCQAFLLRLWPVKQNGATTWRASLQPVSQEAAHGFETLDDLIAYLEALTAEPGAAPAG